MPSTAPPFTHILEHQFEYLILREKHNLTLVNTSIPPFIMAPIAVNDNAPSSNENGTSGLKATARAFHPTGTPDPSRYHAASSSEAMKSEAQYAAHNYHPLPVVISRGAGVSVWDPVRT